MRGHTLKCHRPTTPLIPQTTWDMKKWNVGRKKDSTSRCTKVPLRGATRRSPDPDEVGGTQAESRRVFEDYYLVV